VLPDVSLPLSQRAVPSGPDREAAIAALLTAEADAPFDLAHGPLLRAGLLTLAEREHILLLTIHHAIFDQWSAAVLFQELSALYDAQVSGQPHSLHPTPTQIAACAREQAEWLTSADHDRQLQYWKEQLRAPLPITEMPAGLANSHRTSTGGTHCFELPEPLAGQMTMVARSLRVTPFMLMLTTFMILMHRYTGGEDITVASAVARRRKLGWQSVIGLLMNGVVLRARVQNDDSVHAVLKRVRDVSLQAYDNQDVPHSEVRRAVGAPASYEERARQVYFHSAPRVRPEFANVRTTILPTATSCARSDFGMSIHDELEGGQVRWHGVVEYNHGLFDASAIARIVNDFEQVLAEVCAQPEQRVGQLA
jgi:hypothetical protein